MTNPDPALREPTLQDVYDDEHHFTIEAFWDQGFFWDYDVGTKDGSTYTYAEAVAAIIAAWKETR